MAAISIEEQRKVALDQQSFNTLVAMDQRERSAVFFENQRKKQRELQILIAAKKEFEDSYDNKLS